jgi:hypothetical protein
MVILFDQSRCVYEYEGVVRDGLLTIQRSEVRLIPALSVYSV